MKVYAIRNRRTGKAFAGDWRDGDLVDAYWSDFGANTDYFGEPPTEPVFEAIVHAENHDERYATGLRRADLEAVGVEIVGPPPPHKMTIAGIGSRQAPAEVCADLKNIGAWCQDRGVVLRSGHAEGADLAFETGADAWAQVYLPWKSYNRATRTPGPTYVVTEMNADLYNIVFDNHPAPGNLSHGAQLLMARNAQIILGIDLKTPVDAVVCWTLDEENGGTSFGIRLATRHGIPVYNLAKMGYADVMAYLMHHPTIFRV